MKELLTVTGGYPRVMDFLLNFQSEMLTLGNSLFGALGFDMVLSGCSVVDNGNGTINIAPGLVYISGEAIRFDGANNQVSDGSLAFVKGAYTSNTQLQFADGMPKNVYREAKAQIIQGDPNNIYQIKIKPILYTLAAYIQDTVLANETKGAFKDIYDFDGTFINNFDGSGLGISARWSGWALDNGNNGTPGSAGMALINAGTYTETWNGQQYVYVHGQKYGEAYHKLAQNETPIPGGPDQVDGPHGKPADGGGDKLYYVKTTKQATTAIGHNNMSPSLAVYRVIKIR